MVTIEEKQVNIFIRFCLIFGRAYLPEHSRQIATCLPEKCTSGRDRETHQGEGGGGKTHKGEGQRNSQGEGRRKAQGSYEKIPKGGMEKCSKKFVTLQTE